MTQEEAPARAAWEAFDLATAARLEPLAVLAALESSPSGLGIEEAGRRLAEIGPNAVRSHGARPLAILARQLNNPLIGLLAAAAITSAFVGQGTDAVIILVILGLSVGLGFVNEYRSERAIEELHSRIRHVTVVVRAGRATSIDVTDLVPGDVVHMAVGDVVPADLRVLEATGLECDEAILTGESLPAAKSSAPIETGDSPLDLASCAFMGTVVRAGSGKGVVVRTGARTAFGDIALRLGERPPETAFQHGLRQFSKLLVRVTGVLCVGIFVINAVLRRPLLESLLFALAIAVGLTPQLLPAIVTISLASGARRLARSSVVVKRLVSIEDLGNIEVLFTDKTGTLTEGKIAFHAALDPSGRPSAGLLQLGLLCNEAVVEDGKVVGGNALDGALWRAPAAGAARLEGFRRIAEAPFDFDRRLLSVVVDDPDGRRLLITKGAPENVLDRCALVSPEARATLDAQFEAGARVVAVATREAPAAESVTAADERDLSLAGFLTFVDPPKADAREALEKLARLGIDVKIVTGDNDRVAAKVCSDLGLEVAGTMTGSRIEELSDEQLEEAVGGTTVFARVTPDQKARIIRGARRRGLDVAFMGDGVNDAVALHDADVGISVDTAADVAKDAADIVLLKKDLRVLAEGVVEGRRIFANTIKYVLMGTSSNFGNMFSAAGASLFLKFLPMLPTQILLNNLLYDASQTTIPTDDVDEELLERPARWDTGFIRRFMSFFGPISSVYDFLTFGVMLFVFHADEKLFHTAWFVESLATQTLVIFVIRTRRAPFYRSRPSRPLLLAVLACAGVGVILPYTPLAGPLGFVPLPLSFLAILVLMVVTYLFLAEAGKARFYRRPTGLPALATRHPDRHRRIQRRATRWSRTRISPEVAAAAREAKSANGAGGLLSP